MPTLVSRTVFVLSIATAAHAASAGSVSSEPRAPFDIPRTPEGAPADVVEAALNSASDSAARSAHAIDIASLKGRIAGLRVDDDDLFGTPRWIGSTQRLLTQPLDRAIAAEHIVRQFVAAHRALFEIAPGELDV